MELGLTKNINSIITEKAKERLFNRRFFCFKYIYSKVANVFTIFYTNGNITKNSKSLL
ncbi:hypothetical protein BCD96_004886 [Clostridium beijerinckii]|nr:hypothetical protein [Clostridium beijerinckii]NRU36728.1 hypothetical protein [Clostridium beijerinckii]NSA99993.1 hypothetical protein [Clostridium beijerinckii]OOM52820.1 hypothetical protein CLOBI_52640 [Clostridium beijerinckii]OOM69567.1 hypothetical protein CLBEIC_26210 [Clostridium beijerinckii]